MHKCKCRKGAISPIYLGERIVDETSKALGQIRSAALFLDGICRTSTRPPQKLHLTFSVIAPSPLLDLLADSRAGFFTQYPALETSIAATVFLKPRLIHAQCMQHGLKETNEGGFSSATAVTAGPLWRWEIAAASPRRPNAMHNLGSLLFLPRVSF